MNPVPHQTQWSTLSIASSPQANQRPTAGFRKILVILPSARAHLPRFPKPPLLCWQGGIDTLTVVVSRQVYFSAAVGNPRQTEQVVVFAQIAASNAPNSHATSSGALPYDLTTHQLPLGLQGNGTPAYNGVLAGNIDGATSPLKWGGTLLATLRCFAWSPIHRLITQEELPCEFSL